MKLCEENHMSEDLYKNGLIEGDFNERKKKTIAPNP